jgi:hypothetical protein
MVRLIYGGEGGRAGKKWKNGKNAHKKKTMGKMKKRDGRVDRYGLYESNDMCLDVVGRYL